MKQLLKIVKGKFWICTKLKEKNLLVIKNKINIINTQVLNLLNHFEYISKYSLNKCNKIKFEIYQNFSSAIGINELNITCNKLNNCTIYKKLENIIYLINIDSKIYNNYYKKNINAKDFIIYQNSHMNNEIYYANVILPSKTFIEKESTYFNILGKLQKMKTIIINNNYNRTD
jgi:NADH dehydrogenase/NADH:ubiquinone oxidoreductase subunit G